MAENQTTTEWRAEKGFVYRLVWDGEASVNQFTVLVNPGHGTKQPDCDLLGERIAALLNAAECKQHG